MKVILKNDNINKLKQAKVGFSWTTFFFGWWVPLIRADWKWFLIQFVVTVIANCFTYACGFGTTGGLVVSFVFSFIYNDLYIQELLEKGYKPSDGSSKDILVDKGIISK